MNSNNINSQENSEVRRNAQMQENTSPAEITAIHIIYNEHEKEKGISTRGRINARGLRKDLIIANEINPAEEIYIPAFDSRENEVILPQSISNEIKANRNRRITKTAIDVRKRENQRKDNTMQK